jgi:hypothetical protein
MDFYTNPYESIGREEDLLHNEIDVHMECEVFPLIDEITKEPLYAVHNYLPDEFDIHE